MSNGTFRINQNESVYSRNIGVFLDDKKIKMCFIDKISNPEFAISLGEGKKIDISRVISINDMFYKQDDPDKGPHGDRLAYIAKNEGCPIFQSLKSDKSVVCLRNLSILEPDIFWYNEDNGVQTVNVDENRAFRIKDVLKTESKINKIEEKIRDKEEVVSGIEMQ